MEMAVSCQIFSDKTVSVLIFDSNFIEISYEVDRNLAVHFYFVFVSKPNGAKIG